LTDALQGLREARLAAVIRTGHADDALAIAEALVEGGLTAIELTYTTPGAGTAIARARSSLGDGILVGAGTLTTPEQVAEAVAAGADFLVSRFGPFRGIKVVPTGGIALEDVGAWLDAGASAVGVGGKLAPRRLEDEAARRRLVERCRSVLAGIAAESVR
jgi:2-dehydro-3-deoxyphosphogluconate aldolase/(4S)-4-hydroxy-2-oxoglutarate aldolase